MKNALAAQYWGVMSWVESEAFWLLDPCFADGFEGCKDLERF